MLDISILLLLEHLGLYLLLPLIPGILFIWIFFGDKFKGLLLYIISWFIGIGVITFFIYNLQFFKFGIGKLDYFLLIFILSISFFVKIKTTKSKLKTYIKTLSLKKKMKEIVKSFSNLRTIEKVLTIVMFLYVFLFLLLGFAYNVTFPTYFDDSFGNWNMGSINMFFDGGYKVFGEKSEIMGRGGRIDYPIYISIFKGLISSFTGFWYEIYQNLFQYISFFILVVFTFFISFSKTKNTFFSLIPAFLISGISLVFFHIIDGYMDLASAIYSVFVIYFFYKFLEKYDYDSLLMGFLFGFLLINLKNDGLVVYLPGIIFSLFIVLFLKKDLFRTFKNFFVKENIIKLSFFIVFFLLPAFFVKFYHGFGLNPIRDDGTPKVFTVHTEIFRMFDDIFVLGNNYNLVLLLIPILFIKFKRGNNNFILLAAAFIFFIFLAVFLFTDNYKWVLDQTTVNRVFMSSFVILLSFFTIINYEKK